MEFPAVSCGAHHAQVDQVGLPFEQPVDEPEYDAFVVGADYSTDVAAEGSHVAAEVAYGGLDPLQAAVESGHGSFQSLQAAVDQLVVFPGHLDELGERTGPCARRIERGVG